MRSVSGETAWIDQMVDDMLGDKRDNTPGLEKAARKLAQLVRGFRSHAKDLYAVSQGQPLVAGEAAEAFLRGMANVVLLTILLTRMSERQAEAKAQESMGRDEPREPQVGDNETPIESDPKEPIP